MEMLKISFWNGNNPLCSAADELGKLVPVEGKVTAKKSRALEKFRKAQNCYYDLYNDGLGNFTGEFRRVFGLASSNYKRTRWTRSGRPYPEFDVSIYHDVEPLMEQIVVKACYEQGVAIDCVKA